jgi:general secretion pathway protein A
MDLFPPSLLEPEHQPPLERGTARVTQMPPPEEASSPLDATYDAFYGLHEKPFSLSTDPRFHYQSGAHERAGQALLAAIRTRGGPAVLTAPLGMGKTTLCRSLVLAIDRRTVTSLVLEPVRTIDELLKTMLVDFGVIAADELASAPHVTREMLTSTLVSFLESLAGLDAGAVLFIDEAQHLPAALLGDLAVLMGTPAARVLQIVLVGQPALTYVLTVADLRALDASVSRRIELGPLAADEVSSYVMHRLTIAGANTRVEFDEAAIARLYELSAGVPRVVNLLCDRALTRGHAAVAAVLDRALVDASAEDLDLELPENEPPGLLASLLIVLAFALLMIAGAAAALWVSRDAVGRTIEQWENVPQPPGGPIRRLPVPLAPIPPPAEGT